MKNIKKDIFCTYYNDTCNVKQTCADEFETVCHTCNSDKKYSYKKEYTVSFDDGNFDASRITIKREKNIC